MTSTRKTNPCDGALVPPLFSPDEWQELVRHCELSPRQAEIVGLVMQGRQDSEIIAILNISQSTCRTQLDRAKVRLAARDRTGIVYQVFWKFRQLVELKRFPWSPRDSD